MRTTSLVHPLMCASLFLVLLVAAPVLAETINGTIGDVIPLSGTAPTADMVYLFMTGPDVPPYGSRMDSSVSPVVTGEPDTFTQVPVGGDGWSYAWQTGRVSGGLDPGLYTVYAATEPVAKNALSGVPYSSIDIALTRPVTTGTLVIQSDPRGAQVNVNGRYTGDTPITLQDLAPGTYRIDLSLKGYAPFSGMYDLSAGETEQVSVQLVPQSGMTTSISRTMTTIPGGGDTTTLPSPTRAPLPALVPLTGVVTALLLAVVSSRR